MVNLTGPLRLSDKGAWSRHVAYWHPLILTVAAQLCHAISGMLQRTRSSVTGTRATASELSSSFQKIPLSL